MIEEIITKEINKVKTITNDMTGLCKYFANNISLDLDGKGIPNQIFDIKDITSIDYSHEFILAMLPDKYYLIDPTYIQFEEKDEKLIAFKNWPAKELKNKNQKLYESLINKGYSIIDKKDLKDYLLSFDQNEKEVEKNIKGVIL